MEQYYEDDLTPTESLISLEIADTLLAATLHGRDWTARADADRQACMDDPARRPARADDRCALRDATAILSSMPWRGFKANPAQIQAFPRKGVVTDTGQHLAGIPEAAQIATAILAAHLFRQADQVVSPAVMKSYAVGESRGVFRDPSLDILPDHVRRLISPLLAAGAAWAPVRA